MLIDSSSPLLRDKPLGSQQALIISRFSQILGSREELNRGFQFRLSGGPQEAAPPGALAGAGGSGAGGGASFSSNRPLVLFSVGLLWEDELHLIAWQLGFEKGRRQEGAHDRSTGFYNQVSEGTARGHWSHCRTVSGVGGAPTRGRGYQEARS